MPSFTLDQPLDKIGEALSEWRGHCGFNQADVARVFRVARVTYNRWENGHQRIHSRKDRRAVERAMTWKPPKGLPTREERIDLLNEHLAGSV
jgi:transcriptional regulator with XRE-family HTH domain